MKNHTGKSSFFPFLLLLLLGGLSCKKDQDNLPAVVDIPIAFHIEMKEKLQPGERPLEMELRTLDVLDCSNYGIDYNLNQGAHTIRLTLKDLILEDPCDDMEGVASTTLTFGSPEEGDYKLVVTLKNIIKNEGLLEVNPEHYAIRLETTDGLLISPISLSRIPDNLIWGGVFPQSDSLYLLAETFFSELSILTVPIHLNPGTYTGFRVESHNTITLTAPKVPWQGNTFAFRYEGSRSELINLVEFYRTVGGEGLPILLFDEEGFVY
ncbi:MAG: hypothetical protein IPJ00_03205 [Saprospirales bacterium]|nr:hypothetical protein [Saprospirales bacterium]